MFGGQAVRIRRNYLRLFYTVFYVLGTGNRETAGGARVETPLQAAKAGFGQSGGVRQVFRGAAELCLLPGRRATGTDGQLQLRRTAMR